MIRGDDHHGAIKVSDCFKAIQIFSQQMVGEAELQKVALLPEPRLDPVVVPFREVHGETDIGIARAVRSQPPRHMWQQCVHVMQAGEIPWVYRSNLSSKIEDPSIEGDQAV